MCSITSTCDSTQRKIYFNHAMRRSKGEVNCAALMPPMLRSHGDPQTWNSSLGSFHKKWCLHCKIDKCTMYSSSTQGSPPMRSSADIVEIGGGRLKPTIICSPTMGIWGMHGKRTLATLGHRILEGTWVAHSRGSRSIKNIYFHGATPQHIGTIAHCPKAQHTKKASRTFRYAAGFW